MNPDTPWLRTLVRILTLLVLFMPWLEGCNRQDSGSSAPPPTTPVMDQRFNKAARSPTAAPGLATPPETRLTQIFTVDRILDSLARANIAFNAPPSINLTSSAQIQLLLSLEQSIEALRKTLTQAGDKEGAQIRISDRMEAHLIGQNFQIMAITPEEQAITSKGVTEWKWEVKPTILGRHSLHLTLTALFVVDGNSTRRAIRTFDKTIEVEVTWPQRISGFVFNNWQWLWGAGLAPLVVWLWKRRKSRGV